MALARSSKPLAGTHGECGESEEDEDDGDVGDVEHGTPPCACRERLRRREFGGPRWGRRSAGDRLGRRKAAIRMAGQSNKETIKTRASCPLPVMKVDAFRVLLAGNGYGDDLEAFGDMVSLSAAGELALRGLRGRGRPPTALTRSHFGRCRARRRSSQIGFPLRRSSRSSR
jgi:hypothetical protein